MKATDKHTALTQERLKELLHYDPETGAFVWRVAPRGGFLPGRVAGKLLSGYWAIKIDGRGYYAHRLAYLYMIGEWPDDMLDHANMNKLDNRWSNLRPATRAQNNANRAASGAHSLKGAYFNANRRGKKWQAAIRVDRKVISLGYFATAEEAHAAYCRAAIEHFGAYARSA